MEPKIMTASGKYFNFTNPSKYKFEIESVAHALSQQCRWFGNCNKFFSIAQHSILVSYNTDEGYELEGLLHDGQESVMGDCASPLKAMLSRYSEIEVEAEKALLKQFGLSYPLHHSVKRSDLVVLATEARDIMPVCKTWPILKGVQPLKKIIQPWGPEKAKRKFLERFYELTEKK